MVLEVVSQMRCIPVARDYAKAFQTLGLLVMWLGIEASRRIVSHRFTSIDGI